MKITTKFEGGAELAATLNTLSTRLRRRTMRAALERAGFPIQKEMGHLAPREPGAPDLADNIVMSPTRAEGLLDSDHTAALAIGPAKDYFYGLFQEEGTAFHGAQPFARPAFESGVDAALVDITRGLWSELAAVGVSRTVTRNVPVQSPGGLL